MKKFAFLISITLLSLISFAQGGYLRSNTTYGQRFYRLGIDSTLFFPTGSGAPSGTASLRGYNLMQGAFYFDSTGGKVYVFNPKTSTWSALGSGVGTLTSIYAGLWLTKVNDSTLAGDSATMAAYFLRRSDSTIYYPYRSNPLGYLTTVDLAGYELLANKAIDFGVINNTKYPTTLAVVNYVTGLGYLPKADSTTYGGYYPWSNPLGFITSSSLSGYVPTSRTITINGVAYDLSTNRSWSVGTLTGSDTSYLHARGVASYAKNGTDDSTILTLNDGSRLAAKDNSGSGGITALTGDVTASGSGSVAATLATVNGNVGTFGSASKTVTTTVDAKGRTTAISEQNIAIAESQVTNLTTDLADKIDSLRRIGGSLNVEARKNGTWRTQFTDSVGSSSGNANRIIGTDSIYNGSVYSYRDTVLGIKVNSTNHINIDTSINIGVIYDSTAWVNLTPYTSSGTTSVSSGKILIGAGAKLMFKDTSMLINETLEVKFKYTALNAADSAFKIGWEATNSYTASRIHLYASVNPSTGRLKFQNIAFGSTVYTYGGLLSGGISSGDTVTYTLFHSPYKAVFTVTNNTTGQTQSLTVINAWDGVSNAVSRNTGVVSLDNVTQATNAVTVYRIKWSSGVAFNPKLAVRGNSITYGLASGGLLYNFPTPMGALAVAGSGDMTNSGTSELRELIYRIRPRNALLFLGSNDIVAGIASGVWQANITKMYDSLTAHGINTYFMLLIPRNDANITPINTWIIANYPTRYIDTYTPMWSGTGTTINPAYSSDGVHPNITGHLVIDSTVRASAFYRSLADFYYPSYYRQPAPSEINDSLRLATIADVYRSIGASTFTNTLLTGSAGGQTVYGGTAANENLTLEGTINATKTTSKISLQPTAGNVGIGTSSAAEKFVVAGNSVFGGALSTTAIFSGYPTSGTLANLEINSGQSTSTDTKFAALSMVTSQSGTSNSIASMYFSNPSSVSADKRLAQMSVVTDGATNSGKMYLYTSTAGSLVQALTLDKTGNVGILTTPSARLHVSATAGSNGGILLDLAANGTTGASYSSIDFKVPTTGLMGQFLATASNYTSSGTVNLAANSLGLLAEATSGQLSMIAGGSSGYFTVTTGGYATTNERIRVSATGVTNLFKGANVASAATITPTGNIFHVTGTTTITSVSGTGITAGTHITIIFDGALTFTDGSNLKLAGNMTTSADATITLVYDGTNWYEKSRSIN